MASGIRDAFGLSWRLDVLLRQDFALTQQGKKHRQDYLLNSWARERRRGVDDASRRTEGNGSLLLGKSSLAATAIGIANGVLDWVPFLRDWMIRKQGSDSHGFAGVEEGFFLDGSRGLGGRKSGAAGGGGKTAQIYVREGKISSPILSDQLFWRNRCCLTLLLLRQVSHQEMTEIWRAIKAISLPASILAEEILELSGEETEALHGAQPLSGTTTRISTSETADLDGPALLKNYDPCVFQKRFQSGALCALVRPDFIVFSQAHTTAQLHQQLSIAATVLLPATVDSKTSDARL